LVSVFVLAIKSISQRCTLANELLSQSFVYYLTGPAALAVTEALNFKVVCLGQVLAVTVIVFVFGPAFPLVSNSAFTKPVPPTGIGSRVQSGTVQPHEG
jgi:hypothetical protein